MSSASSSSGITQFGLYRTIDARTEEFLRLSRKRQIRQGCACAAVSTAITVTVVVSVLLVYEYSIISGSNKNRSYVTKPTWLGFINDSADTTPFDAKYFKTQLNFDKTTLKLLPILLKALKQNIFLEKVIEDYTSASPVYESSETTERQYEKNIFSDPKNWFKAPTSRVYAIEFKTSPIVYYQSAMRNAEYMTKIRKIRDYQRILNYFDKMVNDKVSYGSSVPTIKRELPTQKPLELTPAPTKKIKKSNSKSKNKHSAGDYKKYIKRPTTTQTKQNNNCKCPIKLVDLLNKLKTNINQLLPYTKLTLSKLCNIRKPAQKVESIPKIIKKTFRTKFTTLKPAIFITTSNLIEKNKATTENFRLIFRNEIKKGIIENNVQQNIIKLPLEYNIAKHDIKIDSTENRIDNYEKQTTVRNYLEPTESQNINISTTKPMTSVTDKLANFIYQRLQVNNINPETTIASNQMRSKPFISNEEYDEYFATTQKTAKNIDTMDIHNLELIKSKIHFPKDNANKLKNKINEVRTKHIMKTLSDIKGPSLIPIEKYKKKDYSVEDRIDNILYNKKTQFDVRTDKIKASETERSNEVYKYDHNIIHNDNFFNYDDKIIENESLEEFKEKPFTLPIQSNSTNKLKAPKHKIKDTLSDKENLATEINSMLPRTRPVYLEIQRSDWKSEDNRDFDFNVDNNIYDVPNF